MNDIKQKLNPNISLTDYPDEIKSDKWRNLLFNKKGKAHRGPNIFPSEAAARESFEGDRHLKAGYTSWKTLDGKILNKDFSHAIQMPVKP